MHPRVRVTTRGNIHPKDKRTDGHHPGGEKLHPKEGTYTLGRETKLCGGKLHPGEESMVRKKLHPEGKYILDRKRLSEEEIYTEKGRQVQTIIRKQVLNVT